MLLAWHHWLPTRPPPSPPAPKRLLPCCAQKEGKDEGEAEGASAGNRRATPLSLLFLRLASPRLPPPSHFIPSITEPSLHPAPSIYLPRRSRDVVANSSDALLPDTQWLRALRFVFFSFFFWKGANHLPKQCKGHTWRTGFHSIKRETDWMSGVHAAPTWHTFNAPPFQGRPALTEIEALLKSVDGSFALICVLVALFSFPSSLSAAHLLVEFIH